MKETGPNQESEKLRQENPSTLNTEAKNPTNVYQETEVDLNAKILKLTQTIQVEYPELSNFLDELPVTIPNEEHPDLARKALISYYHSLNSILQKYRLEHPRRSNIKRRDGNHL